MDDAVEGNGFNTGGKNVLFYLRDGLREAVKSDYPDISFVMLSMYSNFAWAVKEIQERSVHYLPKPFSKQQLVNAVYASVNVI